MFCDVCGKEAARGAAIVFAITNKAYGETRYPAAHVRIVCADSDCQEEAEEEARSGRRGVRGFESVPRVVHSDAFAAPPREGKTKFQRLTEVYAFSQPDFLRLARVAQRYGKPVQKRPNLLRRAVGILSLLRRVA